MKIITPILLILFIGITIWYYQEPTLTKNVDIDNYYVSISEHSEKKVRYTNFESTEKWSENQFYKGLVIGILLSVIMLLSYLTIVLLQRKSNKGN